MRSRTLVALGFGAFLALPLTAALAGDATAGVDGRQARQRERIRDGVQDGSLTGREAHRLGHQQVRIERMERRMRHDGGGLGPRERVRLDRALDRSSGHIYRQRHDRQAR